MPIRKENQCGAAAPAGASLRKRHTHSPKRGASTEHDLWLKVTKWRKVCPSLEERKCHVCPGLSLFAVGAMVTTGRM